MIQLFDTYNQATKDLHASLLAAGFNGETIIMEADGFLPEGVQSPFEYYLIDDAEEEAGSKALYFNQVPVPDFWEIQGDNTSASILNLTVKKAHITYVPDSYERLVYQVDWLDEAGRIRQKDHYNRFGFCFARTTFDQEGQAVLTNYLTRDGNERILENHVTGHILLSLPAQPLKAYPNRVAFTQAFIKEQYGTDEQILFNTLSQSFFVSFYLEGGPGSDTLVWQEPLGQELPGNMQGILEDNTLRANQILIPDCATYEKALRLIPEEKHYKVHQMGYIYPFKRKNTCRKHALIATHSDQILHLEDLVKALPDVTFHIAAITEMSTTLMGMMAYPNVLLYPNCSQNQLADLFQRADLYLDINAQGELQAATRQAFLNRQLILAFEETAHGRQLTAPSHIFVARDYEQLIAKIKQVLSDRQQMEEALTRQLRAANTIEAQELTQLLTPLLEGGQDA